MCSKLQALGVVLLVVGGLVGSVGAADGGAGWLGPDVREGPPGGVAPQPPGPTGKVGREEAPAQPLTVYIQPRFGIVQLTTAGKQTTEVGAPTWRWPQPTLTMPAPVDFLGGHAPAWRAAAEAAQAIVAAQTAAAAGQAGNALPPPTVDFIGSQGKATVPVAQLTWHRRVFADPAALRSWLEKLNARDPAGHAQAIQFYARTIELGAIDPKGGPNGTAEYRDCFVAIELRPLLVGGGFEAEPVMIENRQVKEVQAQYWRDCGFAEPVVEKFIFTRLRKIKMQLPQRRRNFLGFLHWLNGDWLEIAADPEIDAIKPLASLDYDSEAGLLAAAQDIRAKFKDRKPKLLRVELDQNLRDRVAAAYHGIGAEKE